MNSSAPAESTALTLTAEIKKVRAGIAALKPTIAPMLPATIPFERFEAVVATALSKTPDLVRADRRSLFNECAKAANDNLLPDGVEGALVTFKDRSSGRLMVQWMPMVRGLVKLAYEADRILLSASLVYDRDEFEVVKGTEDKIVHRPFIGDDAGRPVAVYARAEFPDGRVRVEWLRMREVAKVRSVSRAASERSPWNQWTEEMMKKTALRRLAKTLPLSARVDQAVRRDDELVDLGALPAAAMRDSALDALRSDASASAAEDDRETLGDAAVRDEERELSPNPEDMPPDDEDEESQAGIFPPDRKPRAQPVYETKAMGFPPDRRRR